MIQIKQKYASPVPNVLATKGAAAIGQLKNDYDAGVKKFKFDSKIYGHKEVKSRLIELQHGKCFLCESKLLHIGYGDVEHFRPKGGWVQDNELMNEPGYYWLAYDWSNLFLSCQICNQQFKKNLFPLQTPASRAASHHSDIKNEDPYFIHMADEDPEAFITFNEEVPKAVDGSIRGKITIDRLGLARELLNEERRKTLQKVKDIYRLAKGYPDTNPVLKQEAKEVVTKYYNEAQKDDTEYASMLRSFFRKYNLDF